MAEMTMTSINDHDVQEQAQGSVPADEGRSLTEKRLLIVALRAIGLWFIVAGIAAVAANVGQLLVWPLRQFPMAPSDVIAMAVSILGPALVPPIAGILLVAFAEGIARRFYPEAPAASGEIRFGRIGVGDLFRIASFLLGVHLLVEAAAPAGRIIALMMLRGDPVRIVGDALHSGVCTAAGIVLIFGAKQIGRWLAGLRYDPNALPRQQVSIQGLLAWVLAVAIALALIRAFLW